ncbi:MAG TPA: hypothetical protein VMX17_09315 [Candidatus Glassbacteria bacterium]|nr:hypothetical protein [Candidatus Glassbacteria bacterium]
MKSKIFYRLVLITFWSLFSAVLVFADQIAVTEDGKKVLLKDDGTWEYAKEEPKKEEGLYDFRKTTWGMSKIQVKKTEKGKIIKEDEKLLAYQGKVGGLDCFILYILAEGKLVRAKYVFTKTHSNENDYIIDFNTLKETLTKKYDKPVEDTQIWKNDLYKDDYQHWGIAISMGHLVYFASWETLRTNISLMLHGENYKIDLEIEYQSKKLKKLEQKAEEKKALDEF